jgi:DNA-binding CsgD family transcriptional regulator
MAEGATIDARMQAALGRLTDNEKECLRRRLQQQTAKEMALELGVSPHAVEKRLKMARTKLGLSSSLEAARLLAQTEEYQRAGPQSPDLALNAPDAQRPASRHRLAGGIVMSLFIAAALAGALQSSGDSRGNDDDHWATDEQIEAAATENFVRADRDHSGFIEPREIPAPDGAQQAAIAAGDTNHDGKLDLAEYRAQAARMNEVGRKYIEEYLSQHRD